MKTRAKYALIGLFTLALAASLLGGAFWFSSERRATVDVQLIFNNKVSGLTRGASVLFNGLRVGEVTQIDVRPDNPRQISAVIKVDQMTPLRLDTAARIEGQGLAGVVAVQLRGGNPRSAPLTAGPGQSLPTITAETSQDIFETVSSIAKSVEGAVDSIDAAIKQNAGPIAGKMKDVEQFSRALSDDAGNIDKLMKELASGSELIESFPGKASAFIDDFTSYMRSIKRNDVASAIENADRTTSEWAEAAPEINKTIANVASASGKLNRAADQLDGALRGVQSFLEGSKDQNGRSVFNDVADAAMSLRTWADNLNQSSAGMAAEFNRVLGDGLKTVQTASANGRRGLSGFLRILLRLNRDPQSLLFGGRPTIPQYRGPR